jgi:methionyl-tRNA formyltransferase
VPPGTILEAAGRLFTATGDDPLEILELQPAGKRSMTTAEFLRGHHLGIGDSFGPA